MKLVALALLLLTGCADARPMYERVEGATLRIESGDQNCSATAVGRYTILTARHCFDDKPDVILVNGKQCPVWQVVEDGADHALLTLGHECLQRVRAKVSANALKPGTQIFLWGNPSFLTAQLRIGMVSGYGAFPAPVRRLLVLGGLPAFANEFAWVDVESTHGDSGAAVFNYAGEIVGVVSAGCEPITSPFNLMGMLPLRFTRKQWREATA